MKPTPCGAALLYSSITIPSMAFTQGNNSRVLQMLHCSQLKVDARQGSIPGDHPCSKLPRVKRQRKSCKMELVQGQASRHVQRGRVVCTWNRPTPGTDQVTKSCEVCRSNKQMTREQSHAAWLERTYGGTKSRLSLMTRSIASLKSSGGTTGMSSLSHPDRSRAAFAPELKTDTAPSC